MSTQEAAPAKELSVIQKNFGTIQGMIAGRMGEIKAMLPQHLNSAHFIRVYMNSIQRTPALLECTPISLLGALLLCAQFGLEPDGLTRQAYLIPFNNNKKGVKEVQVIIGYGGLVDMARRSGKITGVEARVVREKDKFSYSYGIDPVLDHVPYNKGDGGKPIAFYAIGRFAEGHSQFDVMDKSEVDKVRARSKASGAGPWVTDYDEMGKKTVLRRLCKLLPSSVELQRIISIDERGDAGLAQDLAVLADPDEKSTEETMEAAAATMPARASEAERAPEGQDEAVARQTNRSNMKSMTSRFPAKCQDCGKTLDKGGMIFYNPENKKAYCYESCRA